MARRMLIDATHPEETRVVVVSGNRLEEFDYDTANKAQLKGNIYLAKVTRVEPSLQAAFVDYGGNRHGFLAFSEIHPDYYRIPVEDRADLVDEDSGEDGNGDDDAGSVEEAGGGDEDEIEEVTRRRPRLRRHYKIQEVIKRRQILLVQVVKEERGNKGAALTTYLSLAGRYCVLMPNTSRGGGISRKITNVSDRKRLKSIISDMKCPPGMAVILRTAGSERSKAEIRRDFDYLVKLWDEIRAKTLDSTAPSVINEEANLIKRSIRDLYSKEIEEVLVAGEDAYKTAKDFMKDLIPSHAKKVKRYVDKDGMPLLQRYQIEGQFAAIHDPVVQLRSGGYIVIHQTEALVAIDVNSGRSTRERNIEETALKTNSEASEEIARQLRLRDLAGLIVIDYIDMEENRNNHLVERRLKEAMRRDRARIQLGRISPFGLLEMSRQRLRPSLQEATSQVCRHCGGTGFVLSTETQALRVLRAIEEEGMRKRALEVTVTVPADVALYILNNKRSTLHEIEERYSFRVLTETDEQIGASGFELARTAAREDAVDQEDEDRDEADGERRKKRRRPRRRKRGEEPEAEVEETVEAEAEVTEAADEGGEDGEQTKRRRRRGRRGGRRRRKSEEGVVEAAETEAPGQAEGEEAPLPADAADAASEESADASSEAVEEMPDEAEAAPKKRSRSRSRRSSKDGDSGGKTRRRRTTARKDEPEAEDEAASEAAEAVAGEAEPVDQPDMGTPGETPEEPAEPVEIFVAQDIWSQPAEEPQADNDRQPAFDMPAPEEPAADEEPTAPEPEPLAAGPASPGSEPVPIAPVDLPSQTPEEPKEEQRPKRRGWWSRA